MTTAVRGGLARYAVAATLARTSDGGAVVAVVLLVHDTGGPGWLAGALGACTTAPHLLGPFVARVLDTARDGRRVIAAASAAHGAALAAAVLLLPVAPAPMPAVLLVAAGSLGPLLTGGISSRLPAIAGTGRTAQRRAQGWDVATYGIGGTVGPTVVAAVAAWSSPLVAALVLTGGAVVAAGFVLLLPAAPPPASPGAVPPPARTLLLMLASGPLRRMLLLTTAVAFGVAVLPVAAVVSTGGAAAGVLTAAYGLGNLAGSAGVLVRPPSGEADRLVVRSAAVVVAALVLIASAPSFGFAAAAYAGAGIANGYFFAATLAARSEHAPDAARGQVFVWTGALKITAGSAGTAFAGAATAASARLPLVVAIALTALVALGVRLDRGRFSAERVPR
ncbi:MFS transporter [Saccharopolyspora sp. 6V]|uniref:MFS transporter n=1 Tax=Saccharopolyspora sp. 6V TaxID=2877239 RepID=UPI001CD2A735|nr:MFS transporter [Saccharopolyspora sp. 6V]MCA1193969.1 MFS transporter [Saccharopolyspora sp. 6V]